MNCLIIGGTSGLGLSLAGMLTDTHHVIVTGRHNPDRADLQFERLELSESTGLEDRIDRLVQLLPQIDLVIYAAGFYQDGRITDLSTEQIMAMINVGLMAPTFLVRSLLIKQGKLSGFIAVTSTSQWTPREREPVYTAAKSGLGALAKSLSLDPRVMKTLVVGMAAMATPFWDGYGRDLTIMLDPEWVAARVLELLANPFTYRFAHVLRDDPRVEIQETRT
ncbi:MAG TPA: SDR family NAD(P)-dependent oxidoreductase [Candidatus Saccharimonadia bacterium]|jgi:NAD(P)-dependent dehydrogenase (short-subunit alcohol dehydrogenase family)|nr:SDR family NAD(P)-dependent oxidoreductase [Candidatus Saccharimonadia bacterium]